MFTHIRGGKAMNKGDLIGEVAKVVGTKKEAQAAVDCVFDTITKDTSYTFLK